MGMGETEINLVVVVDVPVQTAHDLVRRGFQRISLITSRIIVVFFRQVLADVVHPHKGTAAYRCGVLERTVHDAVGAPFVIGAATRYARRACLHIILIFAVIDRYIEVWARKNYGPYGPAKEEEATA